MQQKEISISLLTTSMIVIQLYSYIHWLYICFSIYLAMPLIMKALYCYIVTIISCTFMEQSTRRMKVYNFECIQMMLCNILSMQPLYSYIQQPSNLYVHTWPQCNYITFCAIQVLQQPNYTHTYIVLYVCSIHILLCGCVLSQKENEE